MRAVKLPPERAVRITGADVMDAHRAGVWAVCNGVRGETPYHDAYGVLACYEGVFRALLARAGWRLVDHAWLCPECAAKAASA